MFDNISDIDPKVALDTQAITTNTTTVGNTIDRQGFGSVTFLPLQGTVTDGDYEYELYHGDAANMSDEAEVTTGSASVLGTIPNYTADSDDNKTTKFGYRGVKRYLRLKVKSTNVSSGGTMGALAILGHPHFGPIA